MKINSFFVKFTFESAENYVINIFKFKITNSSVNVVKINLKFCICI
jgi:hypothetical protein